MTYKRIHYDFIEGVSDSKMILDKKLITAGIISFLVMMPFCAHAALEPTGEKSAKMESWFSSFTTEVIVKDLLDGNIAFVDGCTTAWVKDKKVDMRAPAVMNEDKSFTIPAEFAETLGISISTDTISADVLASALGYYSFVDDRGFLMLSSEKEAINKTTIGSGFAAYYYDYYNVGAAMGTITWDDVTPTEEDYNLYIKRWRQMLTCPEDELENYNSYVASAISIAEKLLESISWSESALSPFNDVTIPQTYSTTQYMAFESVYSKIVSMAKGYYLDGCKNDKLRDGILYAMELMYNKYYAPGWDETGTIRWTTFQFLLPYYASNVLCLMYDNMPYDDVVKYVNAIWDKSPDPTRTLWVNNKYAAHYYTNRLWVGNAFLNCAVLVHDADRANYVLRYLNQIFEYVDKNADVDMPADGFYSDGSMVFHQSVAYNMGYGVSYSIALASMLMASNDTCFDVRNVYNYEHVYSFITDSYLPFIIGKQKMKMVMGRENGDDAIPLVSACMVILNYAPEDVKKGISGAIKSIVGEYESEYRMSTASGYWCTYPMFRTELARYMDYMENISADEKEIYNRIYYNMDRAVHERDKFRFGLAMSSNRIEKYEGYNTGYGLDEWYIGDGMTYIYTDSGDQYTSNWWKSVNHYYMPGTTVDSTERSTEVETRNNPNWGLPENSFAGGVSDGQDGVAGMILGNQWVSGLEGRKSYFMFGDQIVCLGSGITGGEGDVYTVVDNRLLKEKKLSSNATEFKTLEIKGIKDFADNSEDDLWLIADNDETTNWRNQVIGSWIEFDFGEEVSVGGPAIQFSSGSIRQAIMKFEVSSDGINYQTVFDGKSSGSSESFEFFPVETRCRYFRIVSYGNTDPKSDWITIPEIKFYSGENDAQDIANYLNEVGLGYETVIVDGETIPVDFENARQEEKASWMWMQNFGGYVFLQDSDIVLKREISSPGYSFMITYLDHGENPFDGSYAYVLMPGVEAEETKEWADRHEVEIIENTNKMHAVRSVTNGIVAANLFEGGKLEGITLDKPACIMIKYNSGEYTMYLSDPTQTQKSIDLTFDKPIVLLDGKNAAANNEKNVSVDISACLGDTYSFSWRYKDERNDSGIIAINYCLKTVKPFITTSLYAYDTKGSTLTYEIYRQGTKGTAEIIGNRFMYTSSEKNNIQQDRVAVKVSADDKRYEIFDVYIREAGK